MIRLVVLLVGHGASAHAGKAPNALLVCTGKQDLAGVRQLHGGSWLSGIGRVAKRKLSLAHAGELIVGLGNGGGCGDRGDLTDADGAVCHLEAGLIHHDGLDRRGFGSPKQAEAAKGIGRLALGQAVALGEGVAHRHDHATLDLPLAGQGIDGLAHVVRCDHLADPAGLPVEDAKLGGIAVGHMRHGIWHIGAQRVGLGQVIAVELPALEIVQGFALQRADQLFTGTAGRFAGNTGLAGAGGVAGVRRDPGVGALVDDLVAAQAGVCHHHLHQHGAKALADAGRAGVDMYLAVVLDNELAAAPVGQTHANAGVFHRTGEPHGVAAMDGRVIVGLDLVEGFHKARLGADDLAVGQHAARTDGVAVADLPGGDADKLGHLIEQRLNGKAGLCDAEAAEGAGGGIVGIVGRALDLKVLVGVGSGRVGAGPLQNRAAQRGKGAGIRDHPGLDALDKAVFVAAQGEVHIEGVALGVHQQGLGPRELDLDRNAGKVGDQGRMVLDRHILLAAEAAAHKQVLHLALFIRHAQHGSALVQGGMGALVGGEQPHAAVFDGVGHAALRLQKGVLGPRGDKMAADHMLGSGNGAGRVAAADVLIGLDVAFVPLEDQGRVRPRRFLGRADEGQNLIFHLHQLFRRFQRLHIARADQCHGVAQIVGDLAHGDHGRLVLFDVTYVHLAGNVLCREHADHPGQGLGPAGVDGEHPGAWIFGAHGAAVAHAFEIHVVGVLAVAQNLLGHVQPVDAAADVPVVHRGLGDQAVFQGPGCKLDGLDDLDVAGAAADIVGDGAADLRLGGRKRPVEQPLGTHHHARDAKSALDRAGFAEGPGVDLLFKVGQSLHGEHALALELAGLDGAGPHGLAVDEHRARAARALAAAILAGGQAQLVS